MFHLLKIFTKYGFYDLIYVYYLITFSESCYDYCLYFTVIDIFFGCFSDL